MDKTYYQNLALDLEEMRAFLEDCDEGLAFEVAGKEEIGKRIFQAEKQMAELKRKAAALAK